MSRPKKSPAVEEPFLNLLRIEWAMAPGKAPTAIRDADDLIEAATQHLAAVDRELAALQRKSRRRSTKALREKIDSAREQRTLAQLELIELVELAELPVELMGWA